MSSLIERMNQIGQSLWYDNIERKLLEDGTLKGMISRGEIRGITSNPSIFNKAISQSAEYDREIEEYTRKGLSRQEVYEKLAVADIRKAADLFLPLYQATSGGDGYVSLEVSPYLARETDATIAEAKRLWKEVSRPNLMVKIPGTREGLPAITEAISAGLNINVTLIFSLKRYAEVRDAYLAGLEKRAASGEDISPVASVASFFISRIDTKVDAALDAVQSQSQPEKKDHLEALRGKAAVASGKLAYVDFQGTFESGDRYLALAPAGARKQRALWASTSTKNPAYPDTKYVDDLIGPDTVNTLPPATLEAFLDHGRVENTILRELSFYRRIFTELEEVGIKMDKVTRELEEEGVRSFADSFSSLLDNLQSRMEEFKG
jgi:transaldolase